MPENLKTQLNRIGTKIWNASRNELYVSMRFLDLALNSLDFRMNLSTRTLGTDGISILYNPSYVMERYQADTVLINRSYLHLLFHCLFRHMMQLEGRDVEKWNLACDIAVESILDQMEERCIHLVVSDERETIYELLKQHMKVLTAEGIYHFFQNRQMSYGDFLEWRQAFREDDHSFWEFLKEQPREMPGSHGEDPESIDSSGEQEKRENEKQSSKNHSGNKNSSRSPENQGQEEKQKSPVVTKEQKKELDERWKDISEKMQTDLETLSKGREEKAGKLKEQLWLRNRKKQDYRKFLQRFAVTREEMQIDPDSFDYGFYAYGLRSYGNMPLIEPYEFQEMTKIEEFAIAIDTSGSCKGELVQKFLNETYSILKASENFFKKVKIHIIECDAKVQKDIIIHSEEELQRYISHFMIQGFGGTDFRPVFQYVEQLIKNRELIRLKGLLYFTDGYGIYPKKSPGYDVAFVFFQQDYCDVDVPSWAMKLFVEE